MSELGIFSDEGCMERDIYGHEEAGERLAEYTEDNAHVGVMCDCGGL